MILSLGYRLNTNVAKRFRSWVIETLKDDQQIGTDRIIKKIKMMDEISTMFKTYQDLRPLKLEDQKRLDDKFNLEFNYNSNHIEGNTLTYGQTKLLLFFGESAGDAKMRDLEEMKAHNIGLKWIRERAKDKEYILTERDIRDLNRIILVEDFYKIDFQTGTRYKINVGVYKTRPNSVVTVTGETFNYASPEETPALMYELIKWYNEEVSKEELSPIELASLLHYRYIRIHPFEDGNGRIARLLTTYVLERFGYPMVIIKSDNKDEYLRVLHQCDINTGLTPSDGAKASLEGIKPFVDYMKSQLEWSLSICIKAAKGESVEEDSDFSKKLTVIKRRAEQKRDKIKFSSQEVWNVIEFCFLPIVKSIAIALEPSKQFFYQMQYYNLLFKEGDEEGVHVNYVLRGNADSQTADFIANAKEMKFVYELIAGKHKYFDQDFFRIKEELSVLFAEDSYTVCYGHTEKKVFDYQQYPSQDDVKNIVSIYKSRVLTSIETNSIK